MSSRAAAWLAWSLWVLILAFGATSLDLSEARWTWFVLTHYLGRPDDIADVLIPAIVVLAVPAYATVGAVVASLRPKNGVGWLCLALCLLALLASWQPTNLALSDLAYILSSLAWPLMVPPLPVTLMLLIFPDGRLPSRRWWFVVGMALVGTTPYALTVLLPAAYPAVRLAGVVGFWASLAALLASVVAVVLRWRSSSGQERQQIKWLAYTVSLTVAAVLVAVASWYIRDAVWGAPSYPTVLAGVTGFTCIAVGIPVAIGVALLKYRLYDIDVVINRTLVYGALTVLLVSVYFGGVTVTQALFRTLTGQEKQSQLAIVASTLVIAALFNPLRRRIQSFIDRRFYRSRYDARKTLEAFSAKLRDETDLDALSDDLVGVVRETMQPAHVSLWLRPDTSPKGEQADQQLPYSRRPSKNSSLKMRV
jgi:hypothetical protein